VGLEEHRRYRCRERTSACPEGRELHPCGVGTSGHCRAQTLRTPIPIRCHPAPLLPLPSPSPPLLPLLSLCAPSLLLIRHTAPQTPCHRAPCRPPCTLRGFWHRLAQSGPTARAEAPSPRLAHRQRVGRSIKVVEAAGAWRAAYRAHASCASQSQEALAQRGPTACR